MIGKGTAELDGEIALLKTEVEACNTKLAEAARGKLAADTALQESKAAAERMEEELGIYKKNSISSLSEYESTITDAKGAARRAQGAARRRESR